MCLKTKEKEEEVKRTKRKLKWVFVKAAKTLIHVHTWIADEPTRQQAIRQLWAAFDYLRHNRSATSVPARMLFPELCEEKEKKLIRFLIGNGIVFSHDFLSLPIEEVTRGLSVHGIEYPLSLKVAQEMYGRYVDTSRAPLADSCTL